MNRGDDSAKVDCSEILQQVYIYLDQELNDEDRRAIQAHIEQCAPCLHAVDVERLVKALVARSCTERAPVELRQRVIFAIRQVQLELSQPKRFDIP